MLSFPGNCRLYLYGGITDMRSGFNGLCALIDRYFPGELLKDNSFFIFTNRRRNFIKILYFDRDGLALWSKRLEKGSFMLPENGGKLIIDRRQLMMLLEGVTPLKIHTRFSL